MTSAIDVMAKKAVKMATSEPRQFLVNVQWAYTVAVFCHYKVVCYYTMTETAVSNQTPSWKCAPVFMRYGADYKADTPGSTVYRCTGKQMPPAFRVTQRLLDTKPCNTVNLLKVKIGFPKTRNKP